MCNQEKIEFIYQQICGQKQIGFWENFGYNILSSIIATIVLLTIYDFFWKNLLSFFRNQKYKGKYLHYKIDNTPCIYSGKHNYCDITIKFWSRDTLFIKSYDYNSSSGIWNGEIKIDSNKFMNGIGTYCYEDKSTMGNHRVYSIDEKTIFVQVLDYRGLGNPNLWIKV